MVKPIFLHNWDDVEGIVQDFDITSADLDGVEILLASYTHESYSGDAFVLFRKDGKLYEVNGGHCSWSGLEGQWEPEETTIEALRHRMTEGYLGREYYRGGKSIFADELTEVLNRFEEGP